MRYLCKESLSRRFIDPSDWGKARATFPHSPWKFYLAPRGDFPQKAWLNFCTAARFVQECALRDLRQENIKTGLRLKDILTISAIVINGHKSSLINLPRNFITYFTLSIAQIKEVFKNCTTAYKNDDNLDIRVEGFWPINKNFLEFVCLVFKLRKGAYSAERSNDSAARKLQRLLYQRANKRTRYWHSYGLISLQDRKDQLKRIIKWYNFQAENILKTSIFGSYDYKRRVTILAVKMQRYVDITHLCIDGSSRTSRFVQDYVFLRFGLYPPLAPIFKFRNHYYDIGTYLPLDEALQVFRV